MTEQYVNLLVSHRERVGIIQLNRPEALNALNSELMDELVRALQDFDADAHIGCIVMTGNEKAFAAGADIKQMANAGVVEMMSSPFIGYWDTLQNISKPIVAAVSGYCLGGGCELAMACDIIVAAENAQFGQPEINLGIIPGAGGTQRLTRAVGKSVAMDMILTGRRLSAQEALQFGLVARVFPTASYLEESIALAAEIANKAPLALRMAKESINRAFESSLAEGILFERRAFNLLFATEDQKEGMAAFIQKRKPSWKGR
ncbi:MULTISPECIES: enoyl-CoA hydratase-related protein [Caldilinea]|uniref:Probable enoyl-CoA hydratase echA8 n=1 Tax=Caldilinea aerophila (strain DSM 14535 / JCM 11387 / NBRC 104270 / STL-6-O1) TaxID=926550 RepID=I0I0G2_CALAS|nr:MULTISPECIES: enoyl-CoA hydratase-related protein [Caldilinea]BAL98749.1 enoyl-CoA hydratase [Caldilinea aerophila DSM 14535 = NBRC 104270]GIV74663.1 MAG: enoyl-CoA hydratase [Caldilinea sp.]